ncbi:hypothetical protein XMA152_000653 [Marinobacterium sp. xm-a-152]|nr:hypothetical protein [Marinobacterium sp. xm-a-152]
MIQAFEKAIGQMFQGLGQSALFRPLGSEEQVILVIPKAPDVILDYRDTRIQSETLELQIQKFQVPGPKSGDEIVLNDRCYRLQGEPSLDLHRMVFTVEAIPCD